MVQKHSLNNGILGMREERQCIEVKCTVRCTLLKTLSFFCQREKIDSQQLCSSKHFEDKSCCNHGAIQQHCLNSWILGLREERQPIELLNKCTVGCTLLKTLSSFCQREKIDSQQLSSKHSLETRAVAVMMLYKSIFSTSGFYDCEKNDNVLQWSAPCNAIVLKTLSFFCLSENNLQQLLSEDSLKKKLLQSWWYKSIPSTVEF